MAAPASHGSRPITRAIGPASATNDIIGIEQAKVWNTGGFMLIGRAGCVVPNAVRISVIGSPL